MNYNKPARKRISIAVFKLGVLLYQATRLGYMSTMTEVMKPRYAIAISQPTYEKIVTYKEALRTNKTKPGFYLSQELKTVWTSDPPFKDISIEQFMDLLLSTKRPLIFAESAIRGSKSNWNNEEISILGDVNIEVPVKVYDNGVWSTSDRYFRMHSSPIKAELLFVPGPLLIGKGPRPDYDEVVKENTIDQTSYNKLIERRILPALKHASNSANNEGKQAFVTIPGLGCGLFAGRFQGAMGNHLEKALEYVIRKNSASINNIVCIYFNPHSECTSNEKVIEGIIYRTRPSSKNGKSLLCKLTEYQESKDDFSNCKLFKIVAWDHVSYPGNDFYALSRNTDDGVSAAATNSMEMITGFKGKYADGIYLPPKGYRDWKEVVTRNNIKLQVVNNVMIATNDGRYLKLADFEKNLLEK